MAVAQDDPGHVHAQIPVAADGFAQGIGQQRHRRDKDGIQAFNLQLHPAQQSRSAQSQQRPQSQPHSHLERDHKPQMGIAALSHQTQDNQRQHIGRGVVAPALHLQERSQPSLEVQLAGTQNGEYRGRVRGRDHRSDKHALPQVAVQQPGTEQPGQRSRDHHTQRCHPYGLGRHRPGVLPTCAESTVKDDEDKADGAYPARRFVVVEIDAARPVRAEQHAHHQKNEQRGHPIAVQQFAGRDAHQ